LRYDPIKNVFARAIDTYKPLRNVFYCLLDFLLLRQRYVKAMIRKYYNRSTELHFYDAGAGFCQYTDFVLNHYPSANVHAVDIKTEYLKSYHSSLNPSDVERVSICMADLQHYSPTGLFHLICAIDILEHIEDDDSCLKRFFDVLLPKGKLIISTPSDLDEAAKFTAEHVRPGYNKTALEAKLCAHGFKIRESRYTYGFWGALAWRLLIKQPLQIIAKSKLLTILLPLYYLPVLPLSQILMCMDMRSNNSSGTGILVVAEKP